MLWPATFAILSAILSAFVLTEVSATLPECITCPAAGIWSNWVDYTTCSKSCGLFGKKVQSRNCTSWAFGCPCTGAFSRVIPCGAALCTTGTVCAAPYTKVGNVCGNIAKRADDYKAPTCRITSLLKTCACPAKGLWSGWTSSGTCSATCGLCGTVNQKRTCRSARYGCPCTGATTRKLACQKTPCPGSKCCGGQPLVTNLVTRKPQCGIQLSPDPILPLPTCPTTTASPNACNTCTLDDPPLTIDTETDGTVPFAQDKMEVKNGCVTRTLKCTSTIEGFQSSISLDQDANGSVMGTPTATVELKCTGNGWAYQGVPIETLGCFAVTCESVPSLC